MFVLASPLVSPLASSSSSLSSAHLSKSSRSLSAPSQPVPSPAAPSLDRSGSASTFAGSTAVDNANTGTITDMAVTADTAAEAAVTSNAVASTAVSSNASSTDISANPTASNTTASNTTDRVPAWHAGFLRLLPAIQIHARIAFRRLKKEAREEAVAEVVANALVAYARLVQRGKQDTAFATPLAAFAVRQVWEGRKVGGHIRVRDIMSAYCQRRNGVVIERLDRWDAEVSFAVRNGAKIAARMEPLPGEHFVAANSLHFTLREVAATKCAAVPGAPGRENGLIPNRH